MNNRKAKRLYRTPLQRLWIKDINEWSNLLRNHPDRYPGISRMFIVLGNKTLREL